MLSAELVLRSDHVLTEGGVRAAAVVVAGGVIAAIEPRHVSLGAREDHDLGSTWLVPGIVDTHVHLNEPGRAEWEGFETATRAAAAGGITTLVDMPLNSRPATTTIATLRRKLALAASNLWVDCGFWGGVVPGNASELAGMVEAGALGFKCFLIDSGIEDFAPVSEADLRVAMPMLRALGVPLLVHAELCTEPAPNVVIDRRSFAAFVASRPRRWENEAVALMIALARETGCAVHIVHLSSAEALPMLARAKQEGVPITVETCPHYLTFAAEDVPDGRTDYKCTPPIRERENRERLWDGLGSGVIDLVVCDHSPCSPELKRLEAGDFTDAWGGIASLQLSVSAVWTEARRRGFALTDVWLWMSARSARLAGLEGKGRLAVGARADLAAFAPDETFTVEASGLRHRHKLTPYAGRVLGGVVEATWLAGEKIYDHGNIAMRPSGRVLRKT